MLELRPAPLAEIRPPVQKLLGPPNKPYVRFTDKWPSTMGHVSGKCFEIDRVNQVPYDRSYIIPSGDFRDVDLSNGTGAFQESIYPESNSSLFEITVGWKMGNFLIHFYVPADRHVHSLEFAGMYPNVANVNLRYLGARKPEDSPYSDHRVVIYAVKDLEPIILRHYVLPGIDFDKAVMGMIINKCHLIEIKNPTEEQLRKAKVICYHEEQRW